MYRKSRVPGWMKRADKKLVTITISAIDRADYNVLCRRPGNFPGRDHVMTNLVSPRLWELDTP